MSQAAPSFSVNPLSSDLVTIPLTDAEKKEIPGLSGLGMSVLIVVLTLIFSIRFGLGTGIFIPIIGIAVSISLHLLLKNSRVAGKEKEKARQRNQENVEDASRLSSMLNRLYQQSSDFANQLPGRIKDGYSWLPHAEEEFGQKAYGSFWDAIENSTVILIEVNGMIQTLSSYALEYSKHLEGREHNFPDFPISLSSIPDPTFAGNELRRIARMGQTNFEFANIWEHRRTRQVIVQGFQNLGDAVENLGWIVEQSFSSLNNNVSNQISRLVEQQIDTGSVLVDQLEKEHKLDRTALAEFKKDTQKRLAKQNEMLDNIQSGKKAGLLD